jgi:hypothetical protein
MICSKDDKPLKQHMLSELITHKFFPLDKFMRITNLCKLKECTLKRGLNAYSELVG